MQSIALKLALAQLLRHREKGLGGAHSGLGAPVDRILCSMARPDAPGLRASPGTWTRAYRPPRQPSHCSSYHLHSVRLCGSL